MKSLRKSFNGNKDSTIRQHISTPLPLPPIAKPPSSVLPPQKVIRALASYRPQSPQELPFQKGDFFYVLRDVNQHGAWYEAHNPVTGARGLVPRSMFEEFGKSISGLRTSQFGGSSAPPSKADMPPSTSNTGAPKTPKAQTFYAVVLHDFVAERADELEAKRGDPISVVAQSNREWYVAKPIGKLGRPGLIPVTFVEIRDLATNKAIQDVESLMDRGDLPKVEDWKRAMMNYKQNSIALGVIDDSSNRGVPNSPFNKSPNPSSGQAVAQHPYSMNLDQSTEPPADAPSSDCLPEGILLSANVVSYHYEMDEYWFRIDAIFQPFPPPGSNVLPSAKRLVLFRVYNDFYDFQVAMLNTFPREAGRVPPHPRVLPYMPGPADTVDGEITSTRRKELADYLHQLCDLNNSGAKYILEHDVVRTFLALKPGDVENLVEPKTEEIEALYGHNVSSGNSKAYLEPLAEHDEFVIDMRDTLGQMKLSDRDEVRKSDGSEYEDEGYAPSPQRRAYDQPHPYSQYNSQSQRGDSQNSLSMRQHAHAQNHQRSGSASSFNHEPSLYASNSRSGSPLPPSDSHPPRSYSPLRISGRSGEPSRTSEYSRRQEDGSSTPASHRSHSHSVSTSNVNSPPISMANSQTAFIKIKIFDRVADDLIAIRVHPRVSHADLMGKVQARLGGEPVQLRYRDSMSKRFVELQGDEDLRAWLAGADKHVLYAD